MSKDLSTFLRQKADSLVEKVGIPRACLLLKSFLVFLIGVEVALVCLIIAVAWGVWITHGPGFALGITAIGLVLGFIPDAIRKFKEKPQESIESESSHGIEFLPLPAKFLLCFFLQKKVREPLLGDLEEEYQEIHKQFGQRPANFWFYKQVLTSLWPMLQATGRTLAKWGLLGWLEEVIRRIAH